MRRSAKQLALCAMLAALASALMMLGTLIPVATYCCPMLASLVLIVARAECTAARAVCVWAVTAVLSLLLAPDKEAAALFVCLGCYPVVRSALERISRRPLRVLCKLAMFNLAIGALYVTILFVFPIQALTQEFQAFSRWMTGLLLLGGNGVFLVYDLLLGRLELVYRARLQKTLRKIL